MGQGLSMGSGGSALGHAAFPWGCLGSILPISQEIPGVAGGMLRLGAGWDFHPLGTSQ